MATRVTLSHSDSGDYSLSGDLNMDTVMSCWPERDKDIESAKNQNYDISVDLADIEHVDTSGLAWLVRLAQACHLKDVNLSLKNVPEGLVNLAKLSNVETVLPLH